MNTTQMMMQMYMDNCVIQNMTINNTCMPLNDTPIIIMTNVKITVPAALSEPLGFVVALKKDAGSRLQINTFSNDTWDIINLNNLYAIRLTGTNLYWTLPKDGQYYVTLQPLGDAMNGFQYFNYTPLTFNRFQLYTTNRLIRRQISRSEKLILSGGYIVEPTLGKPHYETNFSTQDAS